jgi:hypothetical protein
MDDSMRYSFHCFGHPNIRAKHHKTIEFTKDRDVTRTGTCIVGVRADFDPDALRRLSGKIRITLEAEDLSDTFTAVVNSRFDDEHEIVFRRSTYPSQRTLGIFSSKVAIGLNRDLVRRMQDPAARMTVTIEEREARSAADALP